MKKILLSLVGIGLFLSAQAQNPEPAAADTSKTWKFGGATSINFSQVALANWAAGGENSYSLNGLLNLQANYRKNRSIWENSLDLGYGIIKQGEREVRKTDDKLDFSSKYGYKTGSNWYYTAALNFKTQFDKGYKYNEGEDTKREISKFMAPAYLLASLGMEYKPGEAFYLFISPLTGKSTFVLDDSLSNAGAFGVDPGKNMRNEFGGFIKMGFTKDIWENVTLNSKVDLFSNYAEEPQNIDVNWEVLISMKVNKFLSANINTQLIYDDDTKYIDDQGIEHGARVQFKEVLGIGLSYKF
jgi:hypothetical protein